MHPPEPEPSFLFAADDNNYNLKEDDAAATFINDLSVGSLFTKALMVVIIVFLLYWLCISIYRHCRGHRSHLSGGDVPNSIPNNSNPVDHHHDDEENLVQNNADIKTAINSYPCFMYGDKKDDDYQNGTTCPICLCEYSESETMRMMPQCGHHFHLKCIDEWLRINWSCPVCRDSPLLPQTRPSS
ncbi:hypothetical protein QN277_010240 [Acacia crassicarpa]|uniref:RING-type domain-containing protein n=1 Tax=Acacia crassicarpa TaxID=499986 RepID=A0AAE1IMI3_9FABA|nr:hypothetical protein QN277_010240 [Acacia crassicarpa]